LSITGLAKYHIRPSNVLPILEEGDPFVRRIVLPFASLNSPLAIGRIFSRRKTRAGTTE
jgi:hypothetical protein